jgi:hypothetical protein
MSLVLGEFGGYGTSVSESGAIYKNQLHAPDV